MTECTFSLDLVQSICIRACLSLESGLGGYLQGALPIQDHSEPVVHTHKSGQKIASGLSGVTLTSFVRGLEEHGYWIRELKLRRAPDARAWFEMHLTQAVPSQDQVFSENDVEIARYMCALAFSAITLWYNPSLEKESDKGSLHVVCMKVYADPPRAGGDEITINSRHVVCRRRFRHQWSRTHPSDRGESRWRANVDERLLTIRHISRQIVCS